MHEVRCVKEMSGREWMLTSYAGVVALMQTESSRGSVRHFGTWRGRLRALWKRTALYDGREGVSRNPHGDDRKGFGESLALHGKDVASTQGRFMFCGTCSFVMTCSGSPDDTGSSRG